MERQTMRSIIEIIYRLRKGESERAIATDLRHHRATVHQYHQLARRKGYLQEDAPLPSEQELLCELGEPAPPPLIPSTVEPYADLVKDWLSKEVEMKAIHRLLSEEHGYTGSYSAVRRFVAARYPVIQEVFVRMETAPAEEAQVDFGTVGKLLHPATGQVRTAYCFVMTLCHSRHQYTEFVFDQTIATFVACHKRALAYFGGVVERVVIDNLKAAILKADLENPVHSIPYRKMAQHYGFLISPCRPATPKHKGKVESGVHYVKRNLWPGVAGLDLNAANKSAMEWIEGYAGNRIHGTTKKQPLLHFRQAEQQVLAALPEHPFELTAVREARVFKDQHVTADNAYYSAPEAYVGKRVEVYLFERVVQLYEGVKLVFTHPRAVEAGQRVTHPGHQPQHKARYLQLTPARCQERAIEIGRSCQELVEILLADRPTDKRRALASLIGLADRYGEGRLEAACKRAIAWQDPTVARVKHTLQNNFDENPLRDEAAHTLVQPLQSYRFARTAQEFFGDSACAQREVVAC